MNKQNGNRPIDMEKKLMVVKGERVGRMVKKKEKIHYCLGEQYLLKYLQSRSKINLIPVVVLCHFGNTTSLFLCLIFLKCRFPFCSPGQSDDSSSPHPGSQF